MDAEMSTSDLMRWIPHTASTGLIMPIGGGEQHSSASEVLREYVRLAGSSDARILVIPTASEDAADVGREYAEVFRQLDVAAVEVWAAETPRAAERPEALAMIDQASGIFMSGGDQGRLADVILNTEAAGALHRAAQRGALIAGTSAGAAFMADLMIEGGESRATPLKGATALRLGLGILSNIFVDTHFGERGRTGRLLEVVASNPHAVTLGLDEDTAAIIDRHLILRVIGSGAVTIHDGTAVRSNVHAINDGDPIMVNGAEMHTITKDFTFDLRARKFVPPLKASWTQEGS